MCTEVSCQESGMRGRARLEVIAQYKVTVGAEEIGFHRVAVRCVACPVATAFWLVFCFGKTSDLLFPRFRACLTIWTHNRHFLLTIAVLSFTSFIFVSPNLFRNLKNFTFHHSIKYRKFFFVFAR